MVLPALHISLGIYLKFFNLLEKNCQIIDLKILARQNPEHLTENDLMETYNNILLIEKKIKEHEKTIELIEERDNGYHVGKRGS